MACIAVITHLWRYPVKSLMREPLTVAQVQFEGIAGDREKALYVRSGHPRAQKTYRGKEHRLLHTLATAQSAQELGRGAGIDLELRSGVRYFDAAPISIVLHSWLREAELLAGRDLDPQRFRPNIFARADASFTESEKTLIGHKIRIGSLVLQVRAPIKRCVTITYDVNSAEPDPKILRSLAQARATVLGIYCDVLVPGDVRLGDALSTEG